MPAPRLAADELVSSETDGQGIITRVNDVFERVSAHPRTELIGAPHSIVRHPDTPAGLFERMWRTLQEGRPFAAYVRNRAGDGEAYNVVLAITPLPDGGYASVGMTPLTDMAGGADDDRRQWEILPAEIAARESTPSEEMAKADEIAETIAALYRTSDRLDKESAVELGGTAPAGESAEQTLLLAPLRAWSTMHGIVNQHMADLETLLTRLDDNSARTRFHIALTHLGLPADASDLIAEHDRLSRRVESKVRSVASLMETPRTLIADWLAETSAAGVDQLHAQVRGAVDSADASIKELRALSQRLNREG